jgi:high-affinity nickel-transport protein
MAEVMAAGASAARAQRHGKERHPWGTYVWMYGVVLLLNVVGWVTLAFFVVPGGFHIPGKGAFGLGLGVVAFSLGLRHAFDADHIAAIDNTTRKIREDRGKQPVSVGFWFSLGHSTVVVVMVAVIAFGVHSLVGSVQNDNSSLHAITNTLGASVSGVFLIIIGVMNLIVLVGIVGVFRRMRHGTYDEAELEAQLDKRGFMNRFFGGLMKFVTRPWHIYPIGVLFGFGFDTVTEVLLLAIAGSAVATGLPWYAVLVLPILFTAGMALMDTTDGAFMNGAYGWAFAKPVRKVFYNMTVTVISVVVALVIGIIELLGVIGSGVNATGGFLGFFASLNLGDVGYGIVALFLATWVVAFAIWKIGHFEERWSSRLGTATSEPAEP